MSTLSRALTQERWELAALCLLVGLSRALAQMPEDSILGLLEVVEGDDRRIE